MGEFTCLVGLNRARIFLEFGWPQWGKSMSERAEKAEALAARIKPILAGNDPDIKGKRRRSFLPAPQRLSPCQRGQCPAGAWAAIGLFPQSKRQLVAKAAGAEPPNSGMQPTAGTAPRQE